MDPTTAHISNWQDITQRLVNRSAEDILFDTVGSAVIQYAQSKDQEAQQWKAAYEEERAKIDYLISLLEQNGIAVPDFSQGVPQFVCKTNKKEKKKKTFKSLLQTDDIDGTLIRLHSKIDGHGGKDVAMVLHRAKSNTLICRFPTEKEFYSEFTNTTGAWRTISYYLDPKHPIDYSSVVI